MKCKTKSRAHHKNIFFGYKTHFSNQIYDDYEFLCPGFYKDALIRAIYSFVIIAQIMESTSKLIGNETKLSVILTS